MRFHQQSGSECKRLFATTMFNLPQFVAAERGLAILPLPEIAQHTQPRMTDSRCCAFPRSCWASSACIGLLALEISYPNANHDAPKIRSLEPRATGTLNRAELESKG